METVGAYEAKTRFSELLELVRRGEQVMITKHGVPVARLVPVAEPPGMDRAAVIAKLKAFRHGRRLRRGELRRMIREGRS